MIIKNPIKVFLLTLFGVALSEGTSMATDDQHGPVIVTNMSSCSVANFDVTMLRDSNYLSSISYNGTNCICTQSNLVGSIKWTGLCGLSDVTNCSQKTTSGNRAGFSLIVKTPPTIPTVIGDAYLSYTGGCPKEHYVITIPAGTDYAFWTFYLEPGNPPTLAVCPIYAVP